MSKLTPPSCEGFKIIDERTFESFGKKFKLENNVAFNGYPTAYDVSKMVLDFRKLIPKDGYGGEFYSAKGGIWGSVPGWFTEIKEEPTPPTCGEFKIIDERTFSFGDRKFRLNDDVEFSIYGSGPRIILVLSRLDSCDQLELRWSKFKTKQDIDCYADWFIEEEKPTFKTIDERTFSFGKRKFRLNEQLEDLSQKIITDTIYLERRTKGGEREVFHLIAEYLDTDIVQIKDFFTEITEEPVTDCDQLNDGWIKHEYKYDPTGASPVEQGTLLLVKNRGGKVFYWNAKPCSCWENDHHPIYHYSTDFMAYKIIAPASEKWIAWNGGECPVDKDSRVNIMFRDGDIEELQLSRHLELEWNHENYDSDIIAYRVVEPKKEEKEQIIFQKIKAKSKEIDALFKELYGEEK